VTFGLQNIQIDIVIVIAIVIIIGFDSDSETDFDFHALFRPRRINAIGMNFSQIL